MKLALGTVQFGIPYGVANQKGQVPEEEVRGILTYAQEQGIDTLDTAVGYGASEEVLGRNSLSSWKIISKMGHIPENCQDVTSWVEDQICGSLKRLGIPSLHGLLLHDPGQLLQTCGDQIFSALIAAKDQGLIQNMGISIYDPSELDLLTERYSFSIVQAPFNIIDRRMLDSGWMARLAEMKVELHVRSAFLQGLLLMQSAERPQYFHRWHGLWETWSEWLESSHLTPLQACIRYTLAFPEISRVLVGVDSLLHLKEISDATTGTIPSIPSELQTSDRDLLNPSHWSLS